MYLLIQNPGVAPVEGFTLLGVSTTRGCGVEGAIGQFGSGNKHAINVLLRAGLKVVAYCGKTRLDFQTRDDEIDDGLTRKPVKRVMCKLGGTSTRTIDLGWVLDFGAIDWTDLGMALREFISNAIDRTLREENGEFVPGHFGRPAARRPGRDEKIKAKDGYTRVYVEMNDEVQRYVDDLPKRFLHFSSDPSQVKKSFLPKADRNLNGKKTAVIYRAGVYVREIEDYTRRFGLRLQLQDLTIADRRVPQLQRLRDQGGHRPAVPPGVGPGVGAGLPGPGRSEADLSRSSWTRTTSARRGTSPRKSKAERGSRRGRPWRRMPSCVGRRSPLPSSYAEGPRRPDGSVRKHRPGRPPLWRQDRAQVLSENEKKGREKTPATEAALAAVDEVWGWLTKYNLTNDTGEPAGWLLSRRDEWRLAGPWGSATSRAFTSPMTMPAPAASCC